MSEHDLTDRLLDLVKTVSLRLTDAEAKINLLALANKQTQTDLRDLLSMVERLATAIEKGVERGDITGG